MRMKLIAGPCVIESERHMRTMAKKLRNIVVDFDVDWYFKASFDKANRTCLDSFRGPGFRSGIRIWQVPWKRPFASPTLASIPL